MTEHVTDDLELYAVGALRTGEAERVAMHLARCPVCREELAAISTVVDALPDMVATREPPPALRDRILAAAAADLPAHTKRESVWSFRPGRRSLGSGALAAAVAVLIALDLNSFRELNIARAERAEYAAIAEKVSHGGRSWYMGGLDQWKGSGGTLIAPARPDLSPFVVFHDLRPLSTGALYAVWLIDPDGHWVRGASFRPDGQSVQSVDLSVPVDTFTQCAVTIEPSPEGKKTGPVVMQSRIAPPAK
jgi:anti-sigma-K factor RskA